MKKEIATHQGTVTAVREKRVTVQIHSLSACASCQAHAHCGFADAKDKTLDIPTPSWQQYREGQTVTVHISQGRGLLAAWIAYTLPALLMLATAIGTTLAGATETTAITATLATLALYLLALHLLRNRLNDKFTLQITPNS